MADLKSALATYSGKRVLITGHTGFKGSWLSLWLQRHGAEVYGYALAPDSPDSHFSLLSLDSVINHEIGDIRDLEHMQKYFSSVQPECIFHLAAQALVRRSYRDPKETFDTNVGGSVDVLECVRNTHSVGTLVFVTSDKCYLNQEIERGYTEEDTLGGHDPYSSSKAAAETAFAAYNDSFFKKRPDFGAVSVRAGNVIGGGDWSEDRIIPDCVRALSKNQPITLRRPHATRPWQHVLEPLSGYVTIGARLNESPKSVTGSWNFGPPETAVHSVEDVARECVKIWGYGEISIEIDENAVHEATLLQLNCDKARRELGWSPRWDFKKTIFETISWYKAVSGTKKVLDITAEQLSEYEVSADD